MAKDLTVRAIECLTPGASRKEVPDGHTRGLHFVLQPSGAASWALRYRIGGKTAKLTLGAYPGIDIKAARRLAGEALQSLARGEDPAEKKRAAKEAKRQKAEGAPDDLEKVVATFIERYAKTQTREATARETERVLRREILGRFAGRRLSSITRPEVHELLDAIIDRGSPIAANRTLAAFRRLCNWAVERGLVETSPCDKVRQPALEQSRDRVLSDAELARAWAAFEAIGWPFGPLCQLLLLTAARRDEVAQATWDEIDLEGRLWTIGKERAKNGAAHQVPLADAAVKILRALPRIQLNPHRSAFVFTTTGSTPVSGFSGAKEAIHEHLLAALKKNAPDAPATPRWTFHDLRRTAASGMGGLGIAPHVIEAVLNHKSGTIKGVAAVYNRFAYQDEKRAALDAWARRVDEVVERARVRPALLAVGG